MARERHTLFRRTISISLRTSKARRRPEGCNSDDTTAAIFLNRIKASLEN